MKYFKIEWNSLQAAEEYRRLALLFHPDKGGNVLDMQNLQTEYNEFKAIKKHWKDISALFIKHYKKPDRVKILKTVEQVPVINPDIIDSASNFVNQGTTFLNALSKIMSNFETDDNE